MNRQLPERELVVLGAGHTHLHILRMWKMHPLPGVRLTCVSNQSHTAYSGMLPGTLAGNYGSEEMQIDLVRRCAAVGARLILAETTGLDRAGKQLLLRDRPPLPYDWLSIGIGSRPASVEGLQHVLSIKPMQTFLERLDQQLAKADPARGGPLRIVVVGGGAGGVEVTFCVAPLLSRRFSSRRFELTLIHRGHRILTGGSPRAAELVQRLLVERDHHTLLKHEVTSVSEQEVVVEDQFGGQDRVPADIVIWAAGAVGPALFEAFDLQKDARGFLLTNIHLQSVDDASIFVVGDSGTCGPRPNPKAGVYAVRQGPLLWDNLRRAMDGRPLREWKPQADFLSLLNTGDDRAILQYKQRAAHGRWCWRLKDSIDRRFIEKHQDYQQADMPAGESSRSADGPMRCDGCGGKLPASVLHRALARLDNPAAAHVRLGLEQADDVAAVQLTGDMSVVATTDFFASFLDDPYTVGRVAALNALSDLLAKGAKPRAALAHAIIPPSHPRQQEQLLFELLAGSLAELRPLGVPIVGGHTIEGERTVLGFTLLGEHPAPAAMRLKSRVLPGDCLVVTKPLGSGVLLAAHRQAQCPGRHFETMLACMLESNHTAAEVADELNLQAATDITGFGLLGHLNEMLRSSGVSAEIALAAVPLLPGAESLLQSGLESSLAPSNRDAAADPHPHAARLGAYRALFDPQTSGGLLLAVPEAKLQEVLERLQVRSRWPPAVIGRAVERYADGRDVSFPSSSEDTN